MKQGAVLSLSLALVTGLTACTSNYNVDPLKDHQLAATTKPVNSPDDLKRIEPVVKEIVVVKEVEKEVVKYVPKEVEKNFAAAQLFQMQALGPISFVAGQASTVNFDVRILQGQSEFDVILEGAPAGAALKVVSAEENKKVVALTFKPAVDFLSKSAMEETRSFKLRLVVKSLTHVDADKEAKIKEAFRAVDRTRAFEMTVRRNRTNPTIDKVEMTEVVEQGKKGNLAVHVTALGTFEGFQPRLFVTYDFKGFNGDLFENNGSPFVMPSTTRKPVEFVSEGKWIFNFDIDTNNGAVVPPQLNSKLEVVNSDTSSLRANLLVYSPTGLTSDERTIRYKVQLKKTVAGPATDVK